MTDQVKEAVSVGNISEIAGSGRVKEPFQYSGKMRENRENAEKKKKQIQNEYYTPNHSFGEFTGR